MSKKKGKKKSRSENRLANVLLATAIIEFLTQIINCISKLFD